MHISRNVRDGILLHWQNKVQFWVSKLRIAPQAGPSRILCCGSCDGGVLLLLVLDVCSSLSSVMVRVFSVWLCRSQHQDIARYGDNEIPKERGQYCRWWDCTRLAQQHAWVRVVVRSILSVGVHEPRPEQAQCGWQAMSVLLLLQPPPPPPAADVVAVAANAAAAEACLLPRLGPSAAAAARPGLSGSTSLYTQFGHLGLLTCYTCGKSRVVI